MPLILPKMLKAVLASTQKASHRSNATILIKKKTDPATSKQRTVCLYAP